MLMRQADKKLELQIKYWPENFKSGLIKGISYQVRTLANFRLQASG